MSGYARDALRSPRHTGDGSHDRAQRSIRRDANERPVLTDKLKDYLTYAKTFEFSWSWDVHIVPTDQVMKFSCPEAKPAAGKK